MEHSAWGKRKGLAAPLACPTSWKLVILPRKSQPHKSHSLQAATTCTFDFNSVIPDSFDPEPFGFQNTVYFDFLNQCVIAHTGLAVHHLVGAAPGGLSGRKVPSDSCDSPSEENLHCITWQEWSQRLQCGQAPEGHCHQEKTVHLRTRWEAHGAWGTWRKGGVWTKSGEQGE